MFDVRLPLGDWCCPAVYSAVADDAAILEGSQAACIVSDSTGEGSSSELRDQPRLVPIGRDFDVGTLEKMLQRRGKAFVHGHMGVGENDLSPMRL